MRLKLTTRTMVVLGTIAVLVGLWLTGPTLVVMILSFTPDQSWTFPIEGFSLRWYESFFSSVDWLSAFGTSMLVGVCVALLATTLATLAALGIQKMASARLRTVLQGVVVSPMVVPPIILAIGIYSMFLNGQLVGTTLGFVLAHTVLALPYAFVAILASLTTFDSRLELAAASLGASRITTFFRITLPGISSGVLSGLVFAFVISFDEVVLSLFLKDAFTETLPVRMFSAIIRDTDPTLAAASTLILILTTTVVLVFASVIERKNRDN